MSCICQYIVGNSPLSNGSGEPVGFSLAPPAAPNEGTRDPSTQAVTDDTKIAGCVSELVDCRAENWLLKKKLQEYEVTVQNLEQLMTTIVNKQHKVLSEMFQLRKRNHELETESKSQREYHAMERKKLLQQLNDIKTMNKELLYPLSYEDEDDAIGEELDTESDLENSILFTDEDEDEDVDGGEEEEEDDDEDGAEPETDKDVEDEEDGLDYADSASAASTADSLHTGSTFSDFSDSGESEESEDDLLKDDDQLEAISSENESDSD